MPSPLGAPDLRILNIPEPWTFGHADTVRFYELDALNHVNNTVYLKWFETIRVRYLIANDIWDYDQSANAPTLVVRALTADYLAPMVQNEDYIVTARTARVGRTSFQMNYAVFAPDIRATGTCTVVQLSADGSSTLPISDEMRQAFITRDGAVQS